MCRSLFTNNLIKQKLVLKVHNDINLNTDSSKVTALTPLDPFAAFDTIDYDTHCAGFLYTWLIDGKPLK